MTSAQILAALAIALPLVKAAIGAVITVVSVWVGREIVAHVKDQRVRAYIREKVLWAEQTIPDNDRKYSEVATLVHARFPQLPAADLEEGIEAAVQDIKRGLATIAQAAGEPAPSEATAPEPASGAASTPTEPSAPSDPTPTVADAAAPAPETDPRATAAPAALHVDLGAVAQVAEQVAQAEEPALVAALRAEMAALGNRIDALAAAAAVPGGNPPAPSH